MDGDYNFLVESVVSQVGEGAGNPAKFGHPARDAESRWGAARLVRAGGGILC